MPLRLAVIIPTLGRKEVVARLLAWLDLQKMLPDEVIISATSEEDVPDVTARFPIRTILGRKGLTAQRNQGLEHALGRFDVITFLDDDLVPATDYLERVCLAFEEHSDWAVIMGRIIRDGATTEAISWEDGIAIIGEAEAAAPPAPGFYDQIGAQGGNMSIRAAMVGQLRFDERLVLYGWQEDIDFSLQLGRRGRIVCLPSILSVHLGVKSGRVSGVRFGYSQVANPVYLMRKGTLPVHYALKLMARNVAANLARSLWPEVYVDRHGRLLGNLLAFGHLVRGRVEPEYILEIRLQETR